MTRTKITALAAALSVLAAAPAVAAEVGAQKTVAKAGQTAPVTVPGTGLKKGGTLKSGQTLVSRQIKLDRGEKSQLTLKCASGSVLRGLVPSEASVSFVAKDEHYVGKRSTVVKAAPIKATTPNPIGTMYALCAKG